MGDRIADLLSSCARVDFGTVNLSREEEAFRADLNGEILALCKCMPQSLRTKTALFLMKYLQASFSAGLNFVNYFYAPAWTILFWLQRCCRDNSKLDPEYMQAAKTGHTMAMLLHALDDHLTDGQLPVTHLALLIRSQSWMIMNQAYDRLARGVERGEEIVRGFIDDYYSSIVDTGETESLERYCEVFKKQMSTWLIAPALLAKNISADKAFSRSILAAYFSFGLAWRLIDDLQDIEKDILKGAHSSIYVCLEKDLRDCWDKDPKEKKDRWNAYLTAIVGYVMEDGVIAAIKKRACDELESAAYIVESYKMTGLAEEFRHLAKPLRSAKNRSLKSALQGRSLRQ